MLEDKKKELEQKYMMYQFLKEQLEHANAQAESMRSAMLETQASISALEEIANNNNGQIALIPLGAGTFIEGKLENIKEAIVSIGSDVLVKDDIKAAKERVQVRLKELEGSYNKLSSDVGSLTAQLQSILPEVERLAGELNYSDSKK